MNYELREIKKRQRLEQCAAIKPHYSDSRSYHQWYQARLKLGLPTRNVPLPLISEPCKRKHQEQQRKIRIIKKQKGINSWRLEILTRDKFICQKCHRNDSPKLIAHHIKSVREYPYLSMDIDNGITLCVSCHTKLHWQIKKKKINV